MGRVFPKSRIAGRVRPAQFPQGLGVAGESSAQAGFVCSAPFTAFSS